MKTFRRKWLLVLAMCSTGLVCQYLGGGCKQFSAQIGLTVFDWCSVLNCDQGSFFNLCSPVQLLVDCP